nr:MAG TPA: hypothetical protein [Caudoviricetes sp.]
MLILYYILQLSLNAIQLRSVIYITIHIFANLFKK